jgi:hypothetical protein
MRAVTLARALALALATTLLSTSIVTAAVWTDQPDYSPGSVVTISGDNSDGAGFLPGETVDVAVSGPNGWTAACSALADDAGAWSCQIALDPDTSIAVGDYSYTALGATSGFLQSGTFTDAANVGISAPGENSGLAYNTNSGSLDLAISGTMQCTTTGTACWGAKILITIKTDDGTNNQFTGTAIVTDKDAGNYSSGSTSWSTTVQFRTSPAPGQYALPAPGLYEIQARLFKLDTNVDSTYDVLGATALNDKAFTIDNTAPTNPTVTGTTPASPANNNTPTVNGTAEAQSTVKVYTNNTCTSASPATGSANNAGNFSVGVSVANDSNTTFWATATDAAGNASGCSTTSVTYVEDSTVVPPTLTGSTPPSPSQNTGPTINGTAEPGATITIYSKSNCGNPVEGTGLANGSGNFAVTVGVTSNSTTTFYGTQQDLAGNLSGCSTTSVTYNADNNGPGASITSGPTNPTTSTSASFVFSVTDSGANASGVGSVECKLDLGAYAACDSFTTQSYAGPLSVGPHQFSVRGTDNAGNVGTAATYSWTINPSDSNAPTVTWECSTDGSSYGACWSGWYTSDVWVQATVADSGSGLDSSINSSGSATDLDGAASTCDTAADGAASCFFVWHRSTDTTGVTYSLTSPVSDNNANNLTTGLSQSIKRDATVPTATVNITSTPNGAGWFKSAVSFSTTCFDATSGENASLTVVPANYTGPDGNPVYSGEGSCTDNAGNPSATDVSDGFKYDATVPTLGLCPVAGPFILGSGTWSIGPIGANDATSLIDAAASTLAGSVDASTIGTKPVVFTAYDNAGNSTTKSCDYLVIYNWSGFFQPIDMFMLNKAKAGSSIPAKFSLGGYQGLNIIATGWPKATVFTCPSSVIPVDEIELYVETANNGLVYDATADQYNYVWKTNKAWAGKCVHFELKLIDGTTHTADFTFFK